MNKLESNITHLLNNSKVVDVSIFEYGMTIELEDESVIEIDIACLDWDKHKLIVEID